MTLNSKEGTKKKKKGRGKVEKRRLFSETPRRAAQKESRRYILDAPGSGNAGGELRTERDRGRKKGGKK